MAFGDILSSPYRMINSFLNPQESYQEAEKQLQDYWNQAQGFERPFINNANAVYPQLNNAMGQLLNPGQLESDWASGYTASPYAQQLLKQNQASGLDAASAMGLNGSSAALNNIQTGAGNIVASDRQQYMQDLMQKFLAGLGLGTGIYSTGAQGANTMAQQAGQMGQNAAQLKYGELAAPGNMFENLLNLGAKLYSGGASGGASSAMALA